MKCLRHSYRYAQEILNNRKYEQGWTEIRAAVVDCPLYVWPGKSRTNKRLDVIQQLLNVWFERRLHVDMGWAFHPNATAISGSQLKADFRKAFDDMVIQAEVQFGNMSRWYSDVFKFQAGYSGQQVRMGISVLPTRSLGVRIDSNVAHFERAVRELPSAEFSITLPILTLGIEPDQDTPIIDVSASKFATVAEITGRGKTQNRWRIVNNLLLGVPSRTSDRIAKSGRGWRMGRTRGRSPGKLATVSHNSRRLSTFPLIIAAAGSPLALRPLNQLLHRGGSLGHQLQQPHSAPGARLGRSVRLRAAPAAA